MDLTRIDKNMKLDTNLDLSDIVFVNIDDKPVEVLGVWRHEDIYVRVPPDVAKNTNPGVEQLATNLAGGKVRFLTDSPYVAINYTFPAIDTHYHMTRVSESGMDMYADGVFCGVFAPQNDRDGHFEGITHFRGEKKLREIIINLPPYNTINNMYIGVSKDAELKKAPEYDKRIVFYGSSINHGACASRHGNSYTATVTRKLNWDCINLGFSGSGRGETIMAEYIASLKMDIFVLDYDHNAPTPEHLAKTHKPFFEVIRKAHPELPIIMIGKPDVRNDEHSMERKQIIESTYNAAIAAGDKNVYYIDGFTLWGDVDYYNCTVDGCHPTDLGMYRMAQKVLNVINKIID